MKTKGVTVCMGLLVLACWVLLASNVSFAADRDNDSFWAPLMQANYDKDKDWGRSNPTPDQFNPSLQPPRHIRSYDGRDRVQDTDQDQGRDRGNHYGWDRGNHHHHPSRCQ